ncbi:unnamed protein product [Nippostrongylus brasiliensis]|uniref:Prophage protein n=1 Tax=Nippostrongylus brasiliensis TaxID=27835 RepID=A0A158R3M8_NIPBR|nr:unnamed protein product [Nippostrongylus brasiliensis]
MLIRLTTVIVAKLPGYLEGLCLAEVEPYMKAMTIVTGDESRVYYENDGIPIGFLLENRHLHSLNEECTVERFSSF